MKRVLSTLLHVAKGEKILNKMVSCPVYWKLSDVFTITKNLRWQKVKEIIETWCWKLSVDNKKQINQMKLSRQHFQVSSSVILGNWLFDTTYLIFKLTIVYLTQSQHTGIVSLHFVQRFVRKQSSSFFSWYIMLDACYLEHVVRVFVPTGSF